LCWAVIRSFVRALALEPEERECLRADK